VRWGAAVVSFFALRAIVACETASSTSAESKAGAKGKVAGIEPDLWKCETIATLDALTPVLGGAVHPIPSAIAPPHGVPAPCSYVVDTTPQEQWTFDVYCRDDYKQQADRLFDEYRKDSDQLTQRFEAAQKNGGLKNDAGVTYIAPERASDLAIGAKALDHHGRGLIFIDDDAPCYVRVIGLDALLRVELAKLLAQNLTYANAPMAPRPAK